ncbi:MAG: helix-turn-helix domain-containing protein [Burkholderiales bacterium]
MPDLGLFGHGSQLQKFIDTPTHGKRLLIEIERKRYRCKACSKTLFESLPDMDAKRSMTDRLRQFIEARALKHTFAEVSRDVGVPVGRSNSPTLGHLKFTHLAEQLAA